MVTTHAHFPKTGTSGSAQWTRVVASSTYPYTTGSTASTRPTASIDKSYVEKVLQRREEPLPVNLMKFQGKTILVTGANGSIGRRLFDRLRSVNRHVTGIDINHGRGVNYGNILSGGYIHDADIIFHCAAAKSAPDGEMNPYRTAQLNIEGTKNVLRYAPGAKVILASTCKACDPETAYGATKLIAERMVLEAGGSVARFYNVVESCGNVFQTWEKTSGTIHATDCWRYFISLEEAVSLMLVTALERPGRYAFHAGAPRHMVAVAQELYPNREVKLIRRRRGDRPAEPERAECERMELVRDRLMQVKSPYDG